VAEGSRTNALSQYFQETQAELRKVVWPTRDEATNLTVVVLAVTAAMTVILGGIDWVFSRLLSVVLSLVGGG
jgi:preprotein translocase subunit SecE